MTEPLCVLHVTYEYPGVTDNCGGGGRVTQLLDAELSARGHDSRVVSDPADGHYTTFPFRQHREIAAAIDEHGPDVVHGHFAIPSSLGLPRLCDRHDVPLVTTCMGSDLHDPTRYQAIRPLLDRAVGYVLGRADAVTVPSASLLQHVPETARHRTRVIHHAARTIEGCTDATLNNPPTLLSVCRLVERKDLETAITAAQGLRAERPVRYRIVGTGPQHEWLTERARGLDWIDVAGYVEDIDTAYRRADVFVLPSQYESFGLVFGEALSAGLPVVASTSGGQTGVVPSDAGMLVPPDSPGQLRRAITDVLNDYREHREAALARAPHFNTARMTDEYTDLYHHVINAKTGVRRRDEHRQRPTGTDRPRQSQPPQEAASD